MKGNTVPVIQIDDDDRYGKVIEWLALRGGTFQSQFPNRLVIGPEQYQGLVQAGVLPVATPAAHLQRDGILRFS